MLEPIILFALGGAGYQAIELAWRGWSHPSMVAVGGLCFWGMGRLPDRPQAGHAFAFCSNWPGGAACRWGQRRYAALQPPAG